MLSGSVYCWFLYSLLHFTFRIIYILRSSWSIIYWHVLVFSFFFFQFPSSGPPVQSARHAHHHLLPALMYTAVASSHIHIQDICSSTSAAHYLASCHSFSPPQVVSVPCASQDYAFFVYTIFAATSAFFFYNKFSCLSSSFESAFWIDRDNCGVDDMHEGCNKSLENVRAFQRRGVKWKKGMFKASWVHPY